MRALQNLTKGLDWCRVQPGLSGQGGLFIAARSSKHWGFCCLFVCFPLWTQENGLLPKNTLEIFWRECWVFNHQKIIPNESPTWFFVGCLKRHPCFRKWDFCWFEVILGSFAPKKHTWPFEKSYFLQMLWTCVSGAEWIDCVKKLEMT